VAAGLMFLLGISGEAFRVRSRELSVAAWRSRAMWVLLALVLYGVAGGWLVKQLYGQDISWRLAYAEAAQGMFGIGRPVEMVAALAAGGRGPPSLPGI
jgi:hypothetical protein